MDWHSEKTYSLARKILKKDLKIEVPVGALRPLAARAAFRSVPAILDFRLTDKKDLSLALSGFRACYLMDAALHNPNDDRVIVGLRNCVKHLKNTATLIDPNSMDSQMDHGAMVAWGSTLHCIADAATIFLPETNLKKKKVRTSVNSLLNDSAFSRDHEPETKFVFSFLNDITLLTEMEGQHAHLITNQPLIMPKLIDPRNPMTDHLPPPVFIETLSMNESRLFYSKDMAKPEWTYWITWLDRLFTGAEPRLSMSNYLLSVPENIWQDGPRAVLNALKFDQITINLKRELDAIIESIRLLVGSVESLGHNSGAISEVLRDFKSSLSDIERSAVNLSGIIESPDVASSVLVKSLQSFIMATKSAANYILRKFDKGLDKVVETAAESGTKWAIGAVSTVFIVKETNAIDLLANLIISAADAAQTLVHTIGISGGM